MTLTFLWTDLLVWLLVFSLIALGYVVGRSPQVQKQWHTIFKSSIAMVSAIVLLVYVVFALLDSIHFHKENSTQMVSLLDIGFEHRINEVERTYSAPFATVEYAKSIVSADGVTKQINLPLKYVTETSILKATLYAIVVGMSISGFLIFLHIMWRKRKGLKKGIAWKAAYITLGVIITIFAWLYILSFDYHVLGTDKVGGDVLYQSLKSIRTGVLIGVLTTLVTLPLAIFLGISAGLFR
ncbi:MAG: Oligopeptide transport system permease protein, partial [uncultured Sulfurovum sp.]